MVPGSIPGGRILTLQCLKEVRGPIEKRALQEKAKDAHAGSRTRVTSMGGLYDAATLHALKISQFAFAHNLAFKLEKFGALAPVRPKKYEKTE